MEQLHEQRYAQLEQATKDQQEKYNEMWAAQMKNGLPPAVRPLTPDESRPYRIPSEKPSINNDMRERLQPKQSDNFSEPLSHSPGPAAQERAYWRILERDDISSPAKRISARTLTPPQPPPSPNEAYAFMDYLSGIKSHIIPRDPYSREAEAATLHEWSRQINAERNFPFAEAVWFFFMGAASMSYYGWLSWFDQRIKSTWSLYIPTLSMREKELIYNYFSRADPMIGIAKASPESAIFGLKPSEYWFAIRPDIKDIAKPIMDLVNTYPEREVRGFMLAAAFPFVTTWPGTSVDWEGWVETEDIAMEASKIIHLKPAQLNGGVPRLGIKRPPVNRKKKIV
jgi:hypothetical protein